MAVTIKCDNQNCNKIVRGEGVFVINVEGKVFDIGGEPSNRLIVCKDCMDKFEQMFGLDEFRPTQGEERIEPAPEEPKE